MAPLSLQAWKDLSQGRGRIKLVEFSMTATGHHLPASLGSSHSGHIWMPFCYKLSLLTPVLMTGKSTLSHYPVLWTSEADAISLVIPEHTASPPDTAIPHQTPYPWNLALQPYCLRVLGHPITALFKALQWLLTSTACSPRF